jgi:hypothetical protein
VCYTTRDPADKKIPALEEVPVKKIALFLCLAAVAVLAAPQVSAFYDPELDDWIVYALADSGGLYMLRGDSFEKVTDMPGGGPYDVSAFYDSAADDWIVYAVNGSGMLHRLTATEFVGVDQIPGGGPYDVTAFYDWQLDDWIVYAFNGGGQLYRLAGNVFQPVAELP